MKLASADLSGHRLMGAMVVLLVAIGAATPAHAASLQDAIQRWMSQTAARSLKKAESADDLLAGGVFALNRTTASAFDILDHAPMLDGVDGEVSFNREFEPRYGLSVERPLPLGGDNTWQLLAGLDYTPSGDATSHLGFDFTGGEDALPLSFGLVGELQQYNEGASEHHLRGHIGYRGLRLSAEASDYVPGRDRDADLRSARPLDALEVSLDGNLPFAEWAWLEVTRAFEAARSPADTDQTTDRLGLRLNPLPPLVVEGGALSRNDADPNWHARFRITLELG